MDSGQRAVNRLGTRTDGPIALARGGTGFVFRLSALDERGEGDASIWGDVYAIIDAERLYRAAGLRSETLHVDFAISPVTSAGGEGAAVRGARELFVKPAPYGGGMSAARKRLGRTDNVKAVLTVLRGLVLSGALAAAPSTASAAGPANASRLNGVKVARAGTGADKDPMGYDSSLIVALWRKCPDILANPSDDDDLVALCLNAARR